MNKALLVAAIALVGCGDDKTSKVVGTYTYSSASTLQSSCTNPDGTQAAPTTTALKDTVYLAKYDEDTVTTNQLAQFVGVTTTSEDCETLLTVTGNDLSLRTPIQCDVQPTATTAAAVTWPTYALTSNGSTPRAYSFTTALMVVDNTAGTSCDVTATGTITEE